MAPSIDLYMQMVRLARRNVWLNWRHSMATIMAIAAGFVAISLLDGSIADMRYRAKSNFSQRGMLGHLLVLKKGATMDQAGAQWENSLTVEDQKFLEEFFKDDASFLRRVRLLTMVGMLSSAGRDRLFIGFGYDLQEGAGVRGETWAWNTLAGEPLDHEKEPSVVIGRGLGELIGCVSTYDGPGYLRLRDGSFEPENRPFRCKSPRLNLTASTEKAQVNNVDVQVLGIIDGGYRDMDTRIAQIGLPLAQKLLDTDKVSVETVELKDEQEIEPFMTRLRAAAAKAGLQLDVNRWQKYGRAATMSSLMALLDLTSNIFMSIVMAIGMMSVANTMMKSVNERVREIGTLRSLGFFQRHIVFMFSLEGLFLSLFACAIGWVMTLLCAFAIDHMGISYRAGLFAQPVPMQIHAVPHTWLLCVVTLSVLATITSLLSSRRAANMVIADAMRHT